MIDLRGLRGHLITLAGIILSVFVWSLLTTPLTKRSSWLVNTESTMDIDTYKSYGSRLVGVLREKAEKAEVKDKRVGVLLGSSTLQDGVDPTVLTADSKTPTRWFSLYGLGLNMLDMRNLSRLLFMSELKPEVVVLAVTPGMLANNDDYFDVKDEKPGIVQLARYALSRQLGPLNNGIKNVILTPIDQVLPNRTWINHFARRSINDLRINFFKSLGIGVASLFPPLPDPWVVPMREERGGVLSPEHPRMKRLLAQLEYRGWFQDENYSPESNRSEAYVEIVKNARKAGATVYVLVLPEPTIMRDRIPLNAMNCITRPLEREFGKDAPRIIDFRTSMADNYFYDHMHLSHEGRPIFSRMLSEALNQDGKK